MTKRELMAVLEPLAPDSEVSIAFLKTDGTAEVFDVVDATAHHGDLQLNVYEQEPEAEPEGEDDEEATEADSEAMLAQFDEICERRGITQEEKDLIWQTMATICYEQVWDQQGTFYEAIKPLFEDRRE